MPKMKSNKSARKRCRVTRSGKIKRSRAGKSHLMSSFRGKRVRQLRRPAFVSKAEEKTVRRMLLLD
jgi:large subunit ribosomal protein L35